MISQWGQNVPSFWESCEICEIMWAVLANTGSCEVIVIFCDLIVSRTGWASRKDHMIFRVYWALCGSTLKLMLELRCAALLSSKTSDVVILEVVGDWGRCGGRCSRQGCPAAFRVSTSWLIGTNASAWKHENSFEYFSQSVVKNYVSISANLQFG